MNIELHEIPVREIIDGYKNSQELGVMGYHGRLNIRPAFQRELIYNNTQQGEVIRSIMKGFPLNVMYWVKTGPDTYDMLDGQQRTLSICRFIHEGLMVDSRNITGYAHDVKEKILSYKLMIYICEGEPSEIIDWFNVINIAGEQLTRQESRNASLTGTWLTDAKMRFSKKECEAKRIAGSYMKGDPIRQEYLETVIRWTAEHDGLQGEKDIITAYMSIHREDENCNDMWLYFQAVMNWVKMLFPKPVNAMKGIDWGRYYNSYNARHYDTKRIQAMIRELMEDDDVTSEKGIYEYLIDGEERHLNLRKFSIKMKKAAYERQNHKCAVCGGSFALEEMEADHIVPWSKGGHTTPENCQVLCRKCNREKGSK